MPGQGVEIVLGTNDVCGLEQFRDVDELVRVVAHVVVGEDDAFVTRTAHAGVDAADLPVQRTYRGYEHRHCGSELGLVLPHDRRLGAVDDDDVVYMDREASEVCREVSNRGLGSSAQWHHVAETLR